LLADESCELVKLGFNLYIDIILGKLCRSLDLLDNLRQGYVHHSFENLMEIYKSLRQVGVYHTRESGKDNSVKCSGVFVDGPVMAKAAPAVWFWAS